MATDSLAVKKLKGAFRRLWPRDPRRPFDELFPLAPKLNVRPPVTIPLPEVGEFPRPHPKYSASTVLHLPEDFTTSLRNVIYCPKNNVIMDRRRRIVAECSRAPRLRYDVHREPTYLLGKKRELPGHAALFKFVWPAYYHTIVDAAPRLLSLWQEPYLSLADIQLLCPGGATDLDAFFVEKLAPPNCRLVELDHDRLYEVEHLIFTPQKAVDGYLRKWYIDEFRKRVLPRRASRHNRRLLISRQGSHSRRISNLPELKLALEHYGFETIRPEEFQIDQEVDLFFDAEVVIGAHGSGLTNMMFAAHTAVIELFATSSFVPHFYHMSKALGHEYVPLFGEGDDLHPREYAVDVAAIAAHVKRFLASSESVRA